MSGFESFVSSFAGTHGLQIFVVSLLLVLIKAALKYMTKVNLFMASADGVPLEQRRAAHFECLRIGMDLALLGLVSLAAVIKLLLGASRPPVPAWVQPTWTTLFLVQVGLLLGATLATALYDSAVRSFKRGIFVPGFLGVLSVLLSVTFFLGLVDGKP